MKIKVVENLLKANDLVAAENRRVFREAGLFCVNMVSSPGSGKTSLIEQTLPVLPEGVVAAVIEGDVKTDLDARRLAPFGVQVVQINTGGGCHLDATMVRGALDEIDVSKCNLLFIENVGNLVCPAAYDLGEDVKALVLSTTEGADKPLKYPRMFLESGLVIINKIDLLPYVDYDLEAVTSAVSSMNPSAGLLRLSCRTGEGLEGWIDWIRERVRPGSR
jgi:hydrogenase nickel incorporation protein HypB